MTNHKVIITVLVAAALIIVPLLMLVSEIKDYRSDAAFFNQASKTTGVVTQCKSHMERVKSGKHHKYVTRYSVYVDYKADGQTFKDFCVTTESKTSYSVGETVDIYYLPGEADDVRLYHSGSNPSPSLNGVFISGFIFLLFGSLGVKGIIQTLKGS